MQCIFGERKRQGWLRLRVAWGHMHMGMTYIQSYIYSLFRPLGRLAMFTNYIHVLVCKHDVHK